MLKRKRAVSVDSEIAIAANGTGSTRLLAVLVTLSFIALFVFADTAEATQADEKIETEELRAELSRVADALSKMTITFVEVSEARTTDFSIASIGERGELLSENLWTVDFDAWRFRIERVHVKSQLENTVGAHRISTWDGLVYRSSSHIPSKAGTRDEYQGSIGSAIPRAVYEQSFTTWLGWQIDGYYKYGILNLLDETTLTQPRLEDDGRTTLWNVNPSQASADLIELRAARIDGRVRLTSLRRWVYAEPDSRLNGVLLSSRTWTFDWSEADADSLLSPVCTVVTRHEAALSDNESGRWNFRQIRIQDISDRAKDDELFRVRFHERSGVWDSRFRIGYYLGGNVINVDGRVLHVAEPLSGDVGENLAHYVATGRFENGKLDEYSANVSRSGMFVAVVVILVALVTPRSAWRWIGRKFRYHGAGNAAAH